MPLTTLKSAVQSSLLQEDSIFSVDALYADFFGPTSPSAKNRYKQDRWLEFVKLSNNEFCTAEDIIFISCIIAHRSRNTEFKDYIKEIRADEGHPAFDLFDPEGENGLAHRHSVMTRIQTKKIANLQTTVASHSVQLEALKADNVKLNDKTAKLEADNVELKTDNVKLNDKTAKLEADYSLLNNRIDRLETNYIELKADNAELKTGYAELKADNVELKAGYAKLEAEIKSLLVHIDALVCGIESLPEYVYNATYNVLSMFNPPIKDAVSMSLKHAGQKVKQYFLQDVRNKLTGK